MLSARPIRNTRRLALLAAAWLLPLAAAGARQEAPGGFTRLFDGRTLNGWIRVGGQERDYQVLPGGILDCPDDSSANLFTTGTYSDFVFRFDFKLAHGANNGVGIRAPLEGDAAYVGMECQILDDSDPMYANLLPGQYHSSVYRIAPARRGSLKPVGEWNHEEITAIGRHIRIVVNGMTTVDTDLNAVTDPETLGEHPGMLRESGHIGFLGHGPTDVQFRDVFVRDLSRPRKDNRPPKGFRALFNGRTLAGWKGLVADPPTRAKMAADRLAKATADATTEALKHWTVKDGEIVYDGRNNNLCTVADYRDFEFMVDWMIPPRGDSGIYLRGTPQVQIWDKDSPGNFSPPDGSGGLYNDQKHNRHPLVNADNPPGTWNHFDILMVGDRVTVYLNGQLVVHNEVFENYWEPDKPIYPVGQIELQHHGSWLRFKNIYVRSIGATEQPHR